MRNVIAMAEHRNDSQVIVLSSLMEAMILLRNGADGVEPAQRSLARVFTQLNASPIALPQLEVLTQLINICCSVMLGHISDGESKIRKLHSMLDEPTRWANWRDDGEFEVKINPSQLGRQPEVLKLHWLNKDDVFTLGYFLSGLCKFQKNVEENGKAERFIKEGLKTVDRSCS